MTKLTDSQLILLSRASQQSDGLLEDAGSMNAGAASKVAAALIRRKLMRETRAKPGMPIWRQDDNGRSWSLMITKAGLKAIAAEDGAVSSVKEKTELTRSHKAKTESAKPDKPPGKYAVIEDRQVQADNPGPFAPRPGSKQAIIVEMLQSAGGASIADMMEATGWLPHSTRAALTGLRKRGMDIERSSDPKRGTIYSVVRSLETTAGA